MEKVPEFVDAEDDLHRKGARWWASGKSSGDADTMAIQAKQRVATRKGWGLAVTPAVCTAKGGISAGVGIAARSAYGMVEHDLGELPACAEGRIAACLVGAVCRGGFHILSVYLWHMEGLTARNLDLLRGFWPWDIQHHSPGAVCLWLVTTGSGPCPCSSGPYLR